VIDVDIDENNAPPAPEPDDETDRCTQENLVFHPGLKLEYFRLHKWGDEWIEAAENLVREKYTDRYKEHVSPSTPVAHAQQKTRHDNVLMTLVTYLLAQRHP
jgi:hypothetical protein